MLMASESLAGAIQLQSHLTIQVRGYELEAVLELQNLGDETARDVYALIHIGNRKQEMKLAERLQKGDRAKEPIVIALDRKDGCFPIIIETTYGDDHHNRYSDVVAAVYTVRGRPSQVKVWHQETGGVEEKASIILAGVANHACNVCVENNSDSEKTVAVRLIASSNLHVSPLVHLCTLQRRETREIRFGLSNRALNPGSAFTIYAIAEYDDPGCHFTDIAPVHIAVEAQGNIFKRLNWGICIAGLVLLIAFILYNIWVKNRFNT